MRQHSTAMQSLPVPLTKEELLQRADRLSWTLAELRALEIEQEAAKKRMKEKHDELKGEVSGLTKTVRERTEERTVEVVILLDDDNKKVYSVRTDSGEVISTRPMRNDEQQLELERDRLAPKLLEAIERFEAKRAADEAAKAAQAQLTLVPQPAPAAAADADESQDGGGLAVTFAPEDEVGDDEDTAPDA